MTNYKNRIIRYNGAWFLINVLGNYLNILTLVFIPTNMGLKPVLKKINFKLVLFYPNFFLLFYLFLLHSSYLAQIFSFSIGLVNHLLPPSTIADCRWQLPPATGHRQLPLIVASHRYLLPAAANCHRLLLLIAADNRRLPLAATYCHCLPLLATTDCHRLSPSTTSSYHHWLLPSPAAVHHHHLPLSATIGRHCLPPSLVVGCYYLPHFATIVCHHQPLPFVVADCHHLSPPSATTPGLKLIL